MKYNDYVLGLNLYKKMILENNCSYSNEYIIESFNDLLKEQDLNDFINECAISNAKFNYEKLNEASDKGPNFLKKFIGRRKIKNNVKKYADAYLAYKMVDLEERKLKTSDKWKEYNEAQRKQAEDAFKKKREAAKELVDATAERMDIIGKTHGVPDYASNWKSLAKVKAIQKVMATAKQIYTDSQYADLKTQFDDLKIDAQQAQVNLTNQEKEDTKVDNIKMAKDAGYTVKLDEIPSDEEAKEKYEDVQTFKDKDGNDVILAKPKNKDDKEKTEDKNDRKETDEKPDNGAEIEKINQQIENKKKEIEVAKDELKKIPMNEDEEGPKHKAAREKVEKLEAELKELEAKKNELSGKNTNTADILKNDTPDKNKTEEKPEKTENPEIQSLTKQGYKRLIHLPTGDEKNNYEDIQTLKDGNKEIYMALPKKETENKQTGDQYKLKTIEDKLQKAESALKNTSDEKAKNKIQANIDAYKKEIEKLKNESSESATYSLRVDRLVNEIENFLYNLR